MRPVRADRELELEQQLVGRLSERIVRAAILRADLAELARPVGHDERAAGIGERRVGRAIGPIVARAGEPAATDLVVSRNIVAGRMLQPARLIAAAPYPLGPPDEGVVDRTLERFPAERHVQAVELRL